MITGVGLGVFEITANSFSGYGFSLLPVKYITSAEITRSLFSLNVNKERNNGGQKIVIRATIFFVYFTLWTLVVHEEKRRCASCNQYCTQGLYFKSTTVFCSERCRKNSE